MWLSPSVSFFAGLAASGCWKVVVIVVDYSFFFFFLFLPLYCFRCPSLKPSVPRTLASRVLCCSCSECDQLGVFVIFPVWRSTRMGRVVRCVVASEFIVAICRASHGEMAAGIEMVIDIR